jgi:hypothetical protein
MPSGTRRGSFRGKSCDTVPLKDVPNKNYDGPKIAPVVGYRSRTVVLGIILNFEHASANTVGHMSLIPHHLFFQN